MPRYSTVGEKLYKILFLNLRQARLEQIDKQKLKKLSRNPFKPSNVQLSKIFNNTKNHNLINADKLNGLIDEPINISVSNMIKKYNLKLVNSLQARRPKY